MSSMKATQHRHMLVSSAELAIKQAYIMRASRQPERYTTVAITLEDQNRLYKARTQGELTAIMKILSSLNLGSLRMQNVLGRKTADRMYGPPREGELNLVYGHKSLRPHHKKVNMYVYLKLLVLLVVTNFSYYKHFTIT